MKKALALLLSCTLLLGLFTLPAAAQNGADAVATVQALGIMNGDLRGDMNLTANVTRAEFAKMLVAASPFRDTVGGSTGYSLFKDVKKGHWAAEYIKVCVENGWFVGYANGTFRPDSTIKLEEAATAALRLLGYTAADLAGSYPTAQLSKFDALGLHAGFSARRGQILTRGDCASLFYNLMAADAKSGQRYAATLGYKIGADGNVDYSSLVSANTKGPYTLTQGALADKLSFAPTAVYRNGKQAALDAAGAYDVYYCNENLRTVWLYSQRVTGTYTAAAPSAAAPSAVTVAGSSYPIESSNAAYKLSSQGTFRIGDTVTLLLGMNGGVADVCPPQSVAGAYYGVVTAAQTQTLSAPGGDTRVSKAVEVACTDGAERTFETGTETFTVGTLVRVNYADSRPVSTLTQRSLGGAVTADGKRLGDYKLAADVQILDTAAEGSSCRIYPMRLAGRTLPRANVLFYETNTAGEISHLILKEATGDAYAYGVLTDVAEVNRNMMMSGTYAYLIAGKADTYVTSNTNFGVTRGPAQFRPRGKEMKGIKNLSKVRLDTVNSLTASGAEGNYAVAEGCQVYILKSGEYYEANLTGVSNAAYRLSGYYDNFGYPAGKQIRILIAEEK